MIIVPIVWDFRVKVKQWKSLEWQHNEFTNKQKQTTFFFAKSNNLQENFEFIGDDRKNFPISNDNYEGLEENILENLLRMKCIHHRTKI